MTRILYHLQIHHRGLSAIPIHQYTLCNTTSVTFYPRCTIHEPLSLHPGNIRPKAHYLYHPPLKLPWIPIRIFCRRFKFPFSPTIASNSVVPKENSAQPNAFTHQGVSLHTSRGVSSFLIVFGAAWPSTAVVAKRVVSTSRVSAQSLAVFLHKFSEFHWRLEPVLHQIFAK